MMGRPKFSVLILVIVVLLAHSISCRQVKKHSVQEDFKGEGGKSSFSLHALTRGKHGYTPQSVIIGILSYIWSYVRIIPEIENLTLRNLENYPLMALKMGCMLYFLGILAVVVTERILVCRYLNLKDKSIFYKSLRKNTLIAYFLLVFFSDEEAFMCISDFFVYFAHFGFYTSISAFREIFDVYAQNVLTTQANHETIPDYSRKIKRIMKYYTILKYILIGALAGSCFIFSDVDKLRLYSLYSPGLVALIDIYLSYENLYYKYKTAGSINERIITFSLNYGFLLNTLSMLIQVANGVKDIFLGFYHSGVPLSFSFIHMFYIMKNLRFFFIWVKECEKFIVFHKNKLLITNKFKLKIYDEKAGDSTKEEGGICLNYLDKARILPCNHQFHLICLLQLVKNGYKKCPVGRHTFEEEENEEIPEEGGPLQNLNDMNFYGLEDD